MAVFIGATKNSGIEIVQVATFEELRDNEWNTKVVFKKNGKTHTAVIYYEPFYREIRDRIFIQAQPKGYKAFKGLDEALVEYIKAKKWWKSL